MSNPSIAAIATAPGSGAIGLIRVCGPHCIAQLNPFLKFSSAVQLTQLPARQQTLAFFQEAGDCIDQVMVCVYRAPHSYTGENLVEIFCHGSPAVLKKILQVLLAHGIAQADPGEFTQRAFLNGKLDLLQAEAVSDLIASQTELSRKAALAQLQGGLSRHVIAIRDRVVEILANIEVELDHSDDPTVGNPLSVQQRQQQLQSVSTELSKLLATYAFGHLLKEGVKIAIVGKPNVGKSSLLNALLKQDRAILTNVPGTTRDTLEECFNLSGIPAVLVDTAGIRSHAADTVETIGIQRSLQWIEKSDVVLFLLDGSTLPESHDQEIAGQVRAKKSGILVITKTDLPQKLDKKVLSDLCPGFPVVPISTTQSIGMEELLRQLYVLVMQLCPDAQALDDAQLVMSLRHWDGLKQAQVAVERVLELLRQDETLECVALEMQEILNALGAIVGETVSEDILSAIFSKFCVGK